MYTGTESNKISASREIIAWSPAAAFIWTQVYFNHRVLTVFTISRQINNSALARRDGGAEGAGVSSFCLRQDKAAADRGGRHFSFNYKRQIFIIYKYLPCMGLNIIYGPVAQ